MNHTPGPWTFEKENNAHQYIKTPFYIRAGDYLIAVGGLQAEKTMGNARLIAAAPTLKIENEKLRKEFNDFLQIIQEHTFEWETILSTPNMMMLTYSQEFKKKLDTAIIKAEEVLETIRKAKPIVAP